MEISEQNNGQGDTAGEGQWQSVTLNPSLTTDGPLPIKDTVPFLPPAHHIGYK